MRLMKYIQEGECYDICSLEPFAERGVCNNEGRDEQQLRCEKLTI